MFLPFDSLVSEIDHSPDAPNQIIRILQFHLLLILVITKIPIVMQRIATAKVNKVG